jgi:hypothetical protein
MQSEISAPPNPKWMTWTGWIISILPVAMLVMSGVMKLQKPPEVLEGIEKLGWSEDLLPSLAIVEIGCAVIYLFPPTAVLGAILLAGYLGGAIATHMRAGDPFIPSMLVPIVLGVVVWLGVYLREPRLRAVLPWRT